MLNHEWFSFISLIVGVFTISVFVYSRIIKESFKMIDHTELYATLLVLFIISLVLIQCYIGWIILLCWDFQIIKKIKTYQKESQRVDKTS